MIRRFELWCGFGPSVNGNLFSLSWGKFAKGDFGCVAVSAIGYWIWCACTMLALWVVTLNQTFLSTQKTFRLQGEGILGALSFVFPWFRMWLFFSLAVGICAGRIPTVTITLAWMLRSFWRTQRLWGSWLNKTSEFFGLSSAYWSSHMRNSVHIPEMCREPGELCQRWDVSQKPLMCFFFTVVVIPGF